jgi:transcription elongation GreA/GreB family factor
MASKIKGRLARAEVFRVVTMKNVVFWDDTMDLVRTDVSEARTASIIKAERFRVQRKM